MPRRFAALVLVSLAIACQTSPTATRTDLRAYLTRTKSWAPVEAEAARTIGRILKTQFVDEAEGHASAFRDPHIVTLKGAGHWVHHDQLGAFLRAVRTFLDVP